MSGALARYDCRQTEPSAPETQDGLRSCSHSLMSWALMVGGLKNSASEMMEPASKRAPLTVCPVSALAITAPVCADRVSRPPWKTWVSPPVTETASVIGYPRPPRS